MLDGTELRLYDSSDNDYISIHHDGVDINFTHNATTDWNISGITAIQAATVDANFDDITSNSNFVLEGDTAQRNIFRTERLSITSVSPGTSIAVTPTTGANAFNNSGLTAATTLAAGGSGGSFALSADGRTLTVDTNNVLGAGPASIMIHDINSSSTSEMYVPWTSVVSSDITIQLYKRGGVSSSDFRTIMDAGDRVDIHYVYFTNS
jgi:hypothetical protein